MRKRLSLLILFILLIPLVTPFPIVHADGYVIDNDVVFNDENIYLAVYPHTVDGEYVYINLTSKVFDGVADFVFGFDSDLISVYDAYWWNPHTVNDTYQQTIPDKYFTNPDYKINYTFSSED